MIRHGGSGDDGEGGGGEVATGDQSSARAAAVEGYTEGYTTGEQSSVGAGGYTQGYAQRYTTSTQSPAGVATAPRLPIVGTTRTGLLNLAEGFDTMSVGGSRIGGLAYEQTVTGGWWAGLPPEYDGSSSNSGASRGGSLAGGSDGGLGGGGKGSGAAVALPMRTRVDDGSGGGSSGSGVSLVNGRRLSAPQPITEAGGMGFQEPPLARLYGAAHTSPALNHSQQVRCDGPKSNLNHKPTIPLRLADSRTFALPTPKIRIPHLWSVIA